MVAVYSFIWLMVCVLLQVLVFNHLHLWGGIVLIYMLPLIKMPVQLARSLQIFLGFACGLIVDIFSNSPGMHALTCTLTMWMRLPLLHMFVISDDIKSGALGKNLKGMPLYARFTTLIVALHVIVLYLIELFSLFNLVPLLIRMIVTMSLTVLFTLVVEAVGRDQ